MVAEEEAVRGLLTMLADLRRSSSTPTIEMRFTSIEALILAHGVSGTVPRTLPSGVRYMTKRACFANAATLVIRDQNRFTYVEGYACGIIPVHHAWCLLADGTIVDPTWRPDTAPIADRYYLGVPVTIQEVYRHYTTRRRTWETVLFRREMLTRDPAEYLEERHARNGARPVVGDVRVRMGREGHGRTHAQARAGAPTP